MAFFSGSALENKEIIFIKYWKKLFFLMFLPKEYYEIELKTDFSSSNIRMSFNEEVVLRAELAF